MISTFVISVADIRDHQSDGIIIKSATSFASAQIDAEYMSGGNNRVLITEINHTGVINRWSVEKNKELEQLVVY